MAAMISLGVIGCGHWGPNHIRIFAQLPDSRVLMCADLDDKRLASIKATYALAAQEWPTRNFWTGAVPYIGPTAIALVGTPAEIAGAFMEYRDAGVSQFILSGWPKLEEMIRFGRDVLPLVREKEALASKSLSRGASKS